MIFYNSNNLSWLSCISVHTDNTFQLVHCVTNCVIKYLVPVAYFHRSACCGGGSGWNGPCSRN